eukprot:4251966-Prymnesium_polylepis.1
MPRRRFQHTICERITDAKSRLRRSGLSCGAYSFRRTRSRSQHAMGAGLARGVGGSGSDAGLLT